MTLAQQFRQEGRQEGEIEAQQRAVIDALGIRFEQIPAGLRDAVERVTHSTRLRLLLRAAIRCASIAEFTNEL